MQGKGDKSLIFNNMDEKKSPSPLFVQRTMGISVLSNTQYLLQNLLDNGCAAQ